jgi:phosphoribosylanthranilate isomerase
LLNRKRIKVCGITRVDDALAAVSAGADALGFVFYEKSPRYLSVESAKQIIDQVPAFVTTVGLFVNADKSDVEKVIRKTKLDLLQFHGDESPEYCESFERPYIKAVGVQTSQDIENACVTYSKAKAILTDYHDPILKGGTGQAFDWDLLPSSINKPLVLAGGLRVENVAQASRIKTVFGLDVSSGVEVSKGIKDASKIKDFFREVYSVKG